MKLHPLITALSLVVLIVDSAILYRLKRKTRQQHTAMSERVQRVTATVTGLRQDAEYTEEELAWLRERLLKDLAALRSERGGHNP